MLKRTLIFIAVATWIVFIPWCISPKLISLMGLGSKEFNTFNTWLLGVLYIMVAIGLTMILWGITESIYNYIKKG